MSRVNIAKITTPAAPLATTADLLYSSNPPGYNAAGASALVAEDQNGVVATIAHFQALSYRCLKVTILTSASANWTPTNGCQAIYVECIGGGGAGGGMATSSGSASVGGGGGGGAYAASWLTGSNANAVVAYACGAGGTAGAAGASGNNGGDTTWATTAVVAKGGSGGGVMAASSTFALQAGGAGGVAASCTGDVRINGGVGGAGIRLSATQGWSGNGGVAPIVGAPGANGVIVVGGGTAGTNAAATDYGSGGSGGATTTTNGIGGTGAPGFIRVWEFG